MNELSARDEIVLWRVVSWYSTGSHTSELARSAKSGLRCCGVVVVVVVGKLTCS